MPLFDKYVSNAEDWAPFLARVLIGGLFVHSGILKFMSITMIAGAIQSVGLPMPQTLAYIAGSVEVLGGLAIITGFWFRYGVSSLIFFTLLVTMLFHRDWSGDMGMIQMTFAIKNMGILAGLLYMLAFGAGGLALGGKKFDRPNWENK